jgi:hypothetical protein
MWRLPIQLLAISGGRMHDQEEYFYSAIPTPLSGNVAAQRALS